MKRAQELPKDDHREITYIQSSEDRFSNAPFSSLPDRDTFLTNTEFWSATQNELGAQQPAFKPHVGKAIKTSRASQMMRVKITKI